MMLINVPIGKLNRARIARMIATIGAHPWRVQRPHPTMKFAIPRITPIPPQIAAIAPSKKKSPAITNPPTIQIAPWMKYRTERIETPLGRTVVGGYPGGCMSRGNGWGGLIPSEESRPAIIKRSRPSSRNDGLHLPEVQVVGPGRGELLRVLRADPPSHGARSRGVRPASRPPVLQLRGDVLPLLPERARDVLPLQGDPRLDVHSLRAGHAVAEPGDLLIRTRYHGGRPVVRRARLYSFARAYASYIP